MAEWDFHVFPRMPGLARALAAGSAYDEFQRQRREAAVIASDDKAAAKARAILARHGTTLCEWETRDIFAAYGIALQPAQLVQSEEEAVSAAASFGKPVALKIQSPDIPHKTEIGGIALTLRTPPPFATPIAPSPRAREKRRRKRACSASWYSRWRRAVSR